jgi:hypothetical protein
MMKSNLGAGRLFQASGVRALIVKETPQPLLFMADKTGRIKTKASLLYTICDLLVEVADENSEYITTRGNCDDPGSGQVRRPEE